jgi:hypothetical protein
LFLVNFSYASLALADSIKEKRQGFAKELKELIGKHLPDAEYSKREKAIQTDKKYWNEGWSMLKVLIAHHNASVSARSLEKHFFWVKTICLCSTIAST